MKIRAFQRTISLTEDETQNEVEFPKIPGSIVGYTSRLIGSLPNGQSCDITWKDGGNNILDPLDSEISEIRTKSSLMGGMVPMSVEHPGHIKAVVTASAALANGEDYSIKLTCWYVENVNGSFKPSDCV